jgi:carboxyl-terminal processing protease
MNWLLKQRVSKSARKQTMAWTWTDDGLQANERSLSADIAIENARKNAKDVLLNEAAAILADEANLLEGMR